MRFRFIRGNSSGVIALIDSVEFHKSFSVQIFGFHDILSPFMKTSDTTRLDVNRRDFIKGSSFATIATLLGGVPLVAQTGAKEESATNYSTGPAFTLKCGVIGLGSWGREIVETLSRLREAEVAAICDTYAPFLRRVGRSAPNAKQLNDYRQMLDDSEIKAVIVATPSHKHKDIVLAALQAGKHVYCEAPLAHSMADARAIAQAAQATPKAYFQSGLQFRSDPQRLFLLPFIRTNAVGTFLSVRAQWHQKTSWRAISPTAERDRELNWRLDRETSPGLIGELGVHQLDAAAWFLKALPAAATGFGGVLHWKDGRAVPDTVQSVVQFPRGVNFVYDATLGNSFDAEYEMYYGTDAAVMIRENKAWLFKEVDSPLLGWEVYARKDTFYKETGIALVANASKTTGPTDTKAGSVDVTKTTLRFALEAFLINANEVTTGVEDFVSIFGGDDKTALAQHVEGLSLMPAATYLDGYQATVMALKANEAILGGTELEYRNEWFELG